jgi:hypothetical protein
MTQRQAVMGQMEDAYQPHGPLGIVTDLDRCTFLLGEGRAWPV